MALAAVDQEGHFTLDVLNDDAIRQCRSISPNCSISPIPRYERNMGFFRQLSRRFGLSSNDELVLNSSNNEDDNQSSSTDSCSSHTAAAAGDNNKKNFHLLHNSVQGNEYISCASSETSSTVDIEEQLHQLQQQQLQQQQQQQSENDSNDDDDDDDDGDNADDDTNNTARRSVYNTERKSFARSSLSRLHRRSTTSLRRAFESFSLSSRSLSCSGATPPPNLPTSSSPSSTSNVTPIKSALKSCSNLELNKKSQSAFLKKSTSTASTTKTKTRPPPQRILRQPVSYTYLKGISGLPTQRVPRNSVCCQYARR